MKLLNVLEEVSNEIIWFIDIETTYQNESGILVPSDNDKSELIKARAKQLTLEVISKLSNALIEDV